MTEKLIEEAAKAIYETRDDAYDLDAWEQLDSVQQERYVCDARAALAVFEKAHTPKVIERHDLVMPIYEDEVNADEVNALITDAQVDAVKDGVSRLAGMQLMRRYSSFGEPWWDALYSGIARAALRAAGVAS